MTTSLAGGRLTIRKYDSWGRPVTAYEAVVTLQDVDRLVVEASWTRGRCDLGQFVLEDGDLFVETYYFARWWNVYEVHGPGSTLRGWYCNVARPARLVGQELCFDDLALDVLVSPAGRILVRDQDEYRALRLAERDPEAHRQALQAVCEIRHLARRGCPPFQALPSKRRL